MYSCAVVSFSYLVSIHMHCCVDTLSMLHLIFLIKQIVPCLHVLLTFVNMHLWRMMITNDIFKTVIDYWLSNISGLLIELCLSVRHNFIVHRGHSSVFEIGWITIVSKVWGDSLKKLINGSNFYNFPTYIYVV